MINDLASRILNMASTLMIIVMVISTISFGVYVSRIAYGGEHDLYKQNKNISYDHIGPAMARNKALLEVGTNVIHE